MTLDERLYTTAILRDHCKHEHDWMLSRRQRLFYTAKALICVLLGREYRLKEAPYDELITAAILDGGNYPCEFGTCYWWECLMVGRGVGRNWWFFIRSDGAP